MSRARLCRGVGWLALACVVVVGCSSPAPRSGEVEPKAVVPPALSGFAAEITSTVAATHPSIVRIENEAQTLKPAGRYFVGLLTGLSNMLNPHPYWEWPYRVVAVPLYLVFGVFDLDSSGSGFYVGDGLVVTNAHVVENADVITCHHADGQTSTATVVKTDAERDLALLRVAPIEGGFPKPLRLRRFEARPGEPVIAIGYPARDPVDAPMTPAGPVDESTTSQRVTVGIVSASLVNLGNASTRYVETDAALNPGNSGGPLVGLDRQVVGVSTMVSIGKENEAYAVPARVVLKTFAAELRDEAAQQPPEAKPTAPAKEERKKD